MAVHRPIALPTADELRTAARDLAEHLQVAVFPVRGKTPLKGSRGHRDASVDPAVIDAIDWSSATGIGIACGAVSDRLIVVDADGEAGRESLGELDELWPADVPEVLTGRGSHLWVRVPAGLDIPARSIGIAPGLDLLGQGGFAIAPPSWHPSGARYDWATGRVPRGIPDATPELLRAIDAMARRRDEQRRARRDSQRIAGGAHDSADDTGTISEGARNRTLFELGCRWRRFGMSDLEIAAALQVANERRCSPPLAEREVEKIARSAGRYPPALEQGRTRTHARGRLARASATESDELTPVTGDEHSARHFDVVGVRDAITAIPCASLGLPEQCTDLGNGELFARVYAAGLIHVEDQKTWLRWDGRRWTRATDGEMLAAARGITRGMLASASELDDDDARARWAKHALATEKLQRLHAMIQCATTEAGRRLEAFDRDPYALTVANGTIDLRSGTLRPHRQADLITQLAPVAYDPAAPAPRWDAFLARVLPDPEVRGWVQRYAGYCLTGDVGEQILAFAVGSGANGKSVLLDTLLAVLGDYGLRAAPDLVLSRHGEAHPTELADLQGRRLVVVSEIDQGRAWAESVIKRLTGDTTITARRMRQDFYTFTATHKLIVAANTRPTVRSTDEAIWRRMRLVPFEVTIPEAERDRHLVRRLIQTEAAGILAWAVRGCLAWQRDGLGPVAAVVAATDDYRAEQDVLAQWIDDECIVVEGVWASTAALYDSYREWCAGSGRHPWSRDVVRARLLERPGIGETRRQRGRVRALTGIALRSDRA